MYLVDRGYDTHRDEISAEENAANLLKSVKEQEAQFEKLSRDLEIERQNVALQLEKCRAGSETNSVSSIGSGDDFIWRAQNNNAIDDEKDQSGALVDSCLKVLEERGFSNQGTNYIGGGIKDNEMSHHSSMQTTTKSVIQNGYQHQNGYDDDYANIDNAVIDMNGGINDRRTLTPRSSSVSSSISGRGSAREPPPQNQTNSSVITSLANDGSLVTTYTTKTTTITDEPKTVPHYQVNSSNGGIDEYAIPQKYATYDRSYSKNQNSASSFHNGSYSSTLPRHTPSSNSSLPILEHTTPEISEEERVAADGSRVLVRKVVTTTTRVLDEDDDVPETEGSRIEVRHISNQQSLQNNGRDGGLSTASSESAVSNHDYNDSLHRREASGYKSSGSAVDERSYNHKAYSTQSMDRSKMKQGSHSENHSSGAYNANAYASIDRRKDMHNQHNRDIREDAVVVEQAQNNMSANSGYDIGQAGSHRNSSSQLVNGSHNVSASHNSNAASASAQGMSNNYVYNESYNTSYAAGSSSKAASSNQGAFVAGSAGGAAAAGALAAAAAEDSFFVDEQITLASANTSHTDYNSGSMIKREKFQYSEEERKTAADLDLDLLDLLMFLRTDDLILKANAAGYIQHLCYNNDDLKIKMRELDMIPLLVRLMEHENEDCHRNAAGALKNLSYGRFMDDNKSAIQECQGIQVSVKLLQSTRSWEVREHVTGILYNLSSSSTIKYEVLHEAFEIVTLLVIMPLSGWDRRLADEGRIPGELMFSPLLRNALGVLRNVSSAGAEARDRLRRYDGLVDALVWMLRASIAKNHEDLNSKIVENIVCTLRNLSYKIDVEIDRDVHPDAIKVVEKTQPMSPAPLLPEDEPNSARANRKSKKDGRPYDAVKTYGCAHMKRKPPKHRRKYNPFTLKRPSNKTPDEVTEYVRPSRDRIPSGVEHIWDPDTVSMYVYLLDKSRNPIVLEASAAVIHNLVACSWNWSALLRIHVRREKGLPPMADLLQLEQEYVVRSVAVALGNLALDIKNKELIGKYAVKDLLGVIPPPTAKQGMDEPGDNTICAVLTTLQIVTHKDYNNCLSARDAGAIPKLTALTREADHKNEKPYRTYSQKTVLEANRVLLHMWEFKDIQAVIKKEFWSHNKAVDDQRAHKQATLKQSKKQGDTFAEMDNSPTPITVDRDARRFVTVDESDRQPIASAELNHDERANEARNRGAEYEMRDVNHLREDEYDESIDGINRERQPLFTNNRNIDRPRGPRTGDNNILHGDEDKIRLVDRDASQTDSWV